MDFSEVDNLNYPQAKALMSYWTSNPPIHIMIKAYLGIGKNEKSEPSEYATIDEAKQIASMFN